MAGNAASVLNAVFANCGIINSFSFGTLALVAEDGSLVGEMVIDTHCNHFLVGDGYDSLIWLSDIGLLGVGFVIGYGKDVGRIFVP